MSATRVSPAIFFEKIQYLPQGGLNPGPAPDGSTELPNQPSTQPCLAPAREKNRLQPGTWH